MKKKQIKICKILGQNLTFLRDKNNLSVIELAKRCGVTRQAIYQLESGKNWISLPLIVALCKFYKIEQHELFQFDAARIEDKEL